MSDQHESVVSDLLDRNKTELTHNVTQCVALWLEERGFKPVETEVPIESGWVADLASFGMFTRTEVQRLKLLPSKPSGHDMEKYRAWEENYCALPSRMTALVEIKTSRGDFRGDTKFTRRPVAHLQYLAVPHDLLDVSEFPEGWGIILCSSDGGRVLKQARVPKINVVEHSQVLDLIASLSIRGHNRTRYAQQRESQKRMRVRLGEQTTISRVCQAIRFVLGVAAGKTVEEAANWHGVRAKLPDDVIRRLEAVRGKLPVTGNHRGPDFQQQ